MYHFGQPSKNREGHDMTGSMKIMFIWGLFCSGVLFVCAPLSSLHAQGGDSGKLGGTITGVVDSPWAQRYPALVYIDQAPGDFAPPKVNPHMSQKGLVFEPHILPVLKGTTVDFTNDDTVAHNVFAPPGSATAFNLGVYGPGVKKSETFNNLGEVPLLCIIHPEMNAYVLVLQNSYFALADLQGRFEIRNVPPGTYQLKVWDEKLKQASRPATVAAGKTTSVEFKGLAIR
jgi:plastocyanin